MLYLKTQWRWSMINLKQLGINLLEAFALSKGKKAEEALPQPLAPLIQRLKLPVMPPARELYYGGMTAEAWVLAEIQNRFPKRISRRVLRKITRHYGVDLRGHGFFRAIPGRSNMLQILPA